MSVRVAHACSDKGCRFLHLTGHVPRELAKHALPLLGGVPDMEMLDVLAEKMPRATPPGISF